MQRMNEQQISECLAIIEDMPSSQAWGKSHVQMYTWVIEGWEPAFASAVLRQMTLTCEWRPAPAALLEMAAQIASPYPSVDDAFREVVYKAEMLGLDARPHPTRPNIFLPGPPAFSHPLVAQAVSVCGGWRMLCEGKSQMSEGLSKQFRASYTRLASAWVQSVAQQLTIPAARRDPALFPAWQPARITTDYVPSAGLPATRDSRPALSAAPEAPLSQDEARQALKEIRKCLGNEIDKVGAGPAKTAK